MRQYFYLVGHSVVGDDFVMDKVFLQKSEAISYGKRLARKNSDYSVYLYKQLISNSSEATIEYVKDILWTEFDESCHQGSLKPYKDEDLFGREF